MNERSEVQSMPPLQLGVRYQIRMEMYGLQAACSLERPDGTVAKVTLMNTEQIESPGTVAFYAENAAASVDFISVCPG